MMRLIELTRCNRQRTAHPRHAVTFDRAIVFVGPRLDAPSSSRSLRHNHRRALVNAVAMNVEIARNVPPRF